MLSVLRNVGRELSHRSWWHRSFTSLDQPSPEDPQTLPPPASYPAIPSSLLMHPTAEHTPILDIPPESDPLLAYLTSHLMHHGKRHAAARRTSKTLLHLHALTRSSPLPILRSAVELAAPSVRIVSHKKGGKNILRPIPLGEKQRTRFAIKWMLSAAENRPGKKIEERLAREVLAIVKGDSEVLKKKEDIHRLAMVNRANAPSRV